MLQVRVDLVVQLLLGVRVVKEEKLWLKLLGAITGVKEPLWLKLSEAANKRMFSRPNVFFEDGMMFSSLPSPFQGPYLVCLWEVYFLPHSLIDTVDHFFLKTAFLDIHF